MERSKAGHRSSTIRWINSEGINFSAPGDTDYAIAAMLGVHYFNGEVWASYIPGDDVDIEDGKETEFTDNDKEVYNRMLSFESRGQS